MAESQPLKMKSYDSITQETSSLLAPNLRKNPNKYRLVSFAFLALTIVMVIMLLVGSHHSCECNKNLNDDDVDNQDDVIVPVPTNANLPGYTSPEDVIYNNSLCLTKLKHIDIDTGLETVTSKSRLSKILFVTNSLWNNHAEIIDSSSFELDICLYQTFPLNLCIFYIYPNNEYTNNINHYELNYKHDIDSDELINGDDGLNIEVADCFGLRDCIAVTWSFNTSVQYLQFNGTINHHPDIENPFDKFIDVKCHYRPTSEPTKAPSQGPTKYPTKSPSVRPTKSPTFEPTLEPTLEPTINPTLDPTSNPTLNPTSSPIPFCMSCCPTDIPTSETTSTSTTTTTALSTENPTSYPSTTTAIPTTKPTGYPSTTTTDPETTAVTCSPACYPATSADPIYSSTISTTDDAHLVNGCFIYLLLFIFFFYSF